jgi:hypothetical protein
MLKRILELKHNILNMMLNLMIIKNLKGINILWMLFYQILKEAMSLKIKILLNLKIQVGDFFI